MGLLVVVTAPRCDQRETLAELDEPVHVEIVAIKSKRISGTGNHLMCVPRFDERFSARVKVGLPSSKAAKLPGKWSFEDQVTLAADATGRRFAYRKNGEPWRPVWIGKKHLLVGTASMGLARDTVDWSRVPRLADAAAAIFRRRNRRVRGDIVQEMKARGAAQLLRFLLNSADADAGGDQDPWCDGYDALSRRHSASLNARLRGHLIAGQANLHSLHRLMLHAALAQETERAAALAIANSGDLSKPGHRKIVSTAAAQASRVDAQATAGWACGVLARARLTQRYYLPALYWVLAAARHPCSQLTRRLSISTCNDAWRCGESLKHDSPLCTSAALEGRIDSSIASLARGQKPRGGVTRAAAAWAVRTGQVPEDVLRAHARRSFGINQSGVSCGQAVAAGVPCSCAEDALRAAACGVGPNLTGNVGNCHFEVDEGARTIGKVVSRRAIQPARSSTPAR